MPRALQELAQLVGTVHAHRDVAVRRADLRRCLPFTRIDPDRLGALVTCVAVDLDPLWIGTVVGLMLVEQNADGA
ncbi:hypothetical protein E1298_07945 [Actinomadura rubrisoli]|uniref:Uncharacterized protein n=1 Tax=Actinomadura rubrisoli TaxID=2530368 RepID=A0A4R5C2S6_9ACTN|nr:hypothetical protein E1298_07945 [Actinomadura rubrisoli]